MRNVLSFLRDPIWQALSVLVAIIAVFISTSQADLSPKELISVHVRQARLIDQWMPGKQVEIRIEGRNYDPSKAIADYFMLSNESNSPIHPSDFASRILALPKDGAQIKQVQSCSQSFAQACSPDGSTTPSGGAYVQTIWSEDKNGWNAEGPLLNMDDAACIIIISEPIDTSAKPGPLAKLSARVAGYNFRSFDSVEKFAEAKTRWYHAFNTGISFQGAAVYWLVLLSAGIMFATFRLLEISRSGIQPNTSYSINQVTVALLAVSTAEILSDVYFNRDGNIFDPYLSPIVWPLLAVHLMYICFLVVRAFSARRRNVG